MTAELRQINREILSRVNRRLIERARRLLSLKMRGQAFRTVMQAEEAMEVAGLETYDINEPAQHIDLGRMKVPPPLLPKALIAEEVLARRFERTVENEFVVVLDLSRSMRFPLQRLYAGHPLPEDLTLSAAESAKPNLMKLIAATFVNAATKSGFVVRRVTFGPHKPRMDPLARGRVDLLKDLMERVDEHFCRISAHSQTEEPQYERVLQYLASRKGVFLFVSDFLPAVKDWDDPQKRRRWQRVLGLFRQWGHRRPLLVVRVNDYEEVRPPPAGRDVASQMISRFGDRCDVAVESTLEDANRPPPRLTNEAVEDAIKRLQEQQAWERVLSATLHSCCRGYLTVNDRTAGPILAREMHRMWLRIVRR